MAELVDAPGSGPGGRKAVLVRLQSRAPSTSLRSRSALQVSRSEPKASEDQQAGRAKRAPAERAVLVRLQSRAPSTAHPRSAVAESSRRESNAAAARTQLHHSTRWSRPTNSPISPSNGLVPAIEILRSHAIACRGGARAHEGQDQEGGRIARDRARTRAVECRAAPPTRTDARRSQAHDRRVDELSGRDREPGQGRIRRSGGRRAARGGGPSRARARSLGGARGRRAAARTPDRRSPGAARRTRSDSARGATAPRRSSC